jgi:hypothetical protein
MLGIPSAATKVQPVRVIGLLVPAQATSLMTTSKGLAAICRGGRVGSETGISAGSAVDVPTSIGGEVTSRLEMVVSPGGASVARDVAVEVAVAISVRGGSDPVEVEVGMAVRVAVAGEVRVSWAAQVAVLPRSILMPTSNRGTTSQQRSNGLAFMLSPLRCKAIKSEPQVSVQLPSRKAAS